MLGQVLLDPLYLYRVSVSVLAALERQVVEHGPYVRRMVVSGLNLGREADTHNTKLNCLLLSCISCFCVWIYQESLD